MLLPLFALLALAALAAPVLADKPVTSIDEWIGFDFGNVGTSTDTYTVTLFKEGCLIVTDAFCSGDQFRIEINGHDRGFTSTPSATWCTMQVDDNLESALSHADFSKGYFPIASTTSFKITVAKTPRGGGGYFKISSTGCPMIFKVVTAFGLFTSRADAAKACEEVGLTLADVTWATWDAVPSAVRAIPDLQNNPTAAVIINSWNGDPYNDVTLQLSVSPRNGAVTTLTEPAFPLCQSFDVSLEAPAASADASAAASFAGTSAAPKDTHNGRVVVGK
ncbi:hypothetical protein GGF31_006481 [Allomyces arbusculus]|nr:hypothetical protein GGF31_006481 [Allomyces arbusculus]